MKNSAKFFIAVVIVSGAAVLINSVLHAQSRDQVRFVSFLLVACVAARLKVKLPGITGSMSVNLPFILVAAAEMSSSEALVIACFSTFVQCLPQVEQKVNAVQAIFNFANMALAVAATRLVFAYPALHDQYHSGCDHHLADGRQKRSESLERYLPALVPILRGERRRRGYCADGNGDDRLAGSTVRNASDVRDLHFVQALFWHVPRNGPRANRGRCQRCIILELLLFSVSAYSRSGS